MRWPGRAAGVKVALLGPIAWRTPPRALRPVGAGDRPARRRPRRPRRRRDALRHARLAAPPRRSTASARARTPRTRTWTGGSGRRCTSPTRWAARREFDLVHNHLDWLPLASPSTCAGPAGDHRSTASPPGHPAGLPRAPGRRYVSISDADRVPELDYVATVHHGVDVAALPFSPGPAATDLVSFGRIHPDKGTAEAIDIARRAGRRLVICGIVQDERYFDRAGRAAHRRRPGRPPRLGRAGSSGPRCSAAPPPCCTRSPSTSRSGSQSSSRWCAAPRCSPTVAARCRRSSTTASPASLSTTSIRRSGRWRRSLGSTGTGVATRPYTGSVRPHGGRLS